MPRQKASELSRLEQPMILDQLRRTLHQDAALEGIGSALAEIRGALEQFDVAADRASSDPRLSGTGQREALEQAARTTLAAIDAWSAQHADAVQSMAERLASALVPTPSPPDVVTALRRQELRAGMRELSAVERSAIYLGADPELQEAMETAPAMLTRATPEAAATIAPLIDPELVQVRRRERAAAAHPELAAQVADAERIARVYSSTASTARTAILNVVGFLPPEPEPAPSGG